MNTNAKPAHAAGYADFTFDAKLKAAISKVKGIPHIEKIKLYHAIVGVCREQVEDCCDGLSCAIFLELHDTYGFGQKRAGHLVEISQATLDRYVEKYDVGAVTALKRDLRQRKIYIGVEKDNGTT